MRLCEELRPDVIILDITMPRLNGIEVAERAHAYLRGLLLDNADNKTAEAIALKVYGDPSQVRMMQVFVSQAPWPDAPLPKMNDCAPPPIDGANATSSCDGGEK